MNDKTENENKSQNVPATVDDGQRGVVPTDGGELSADGRGGVPSEQPPLRVYDGENERGMGGGYASVKGKRVFGGVDGLVWITLIVMTVLCIAVGVCSSLLTAHFMKSGERPPVIGTGDVQQNIAAVVSTRKSCVAELACGSLRGSCVIMKRSGNTVYAVTNAHIIERYFDGGILPSVRFYGEDIFYAATVVGYDLHYDVAVLTVEHKTAFTVYDLDGSDGFSPDIAVNEGDYVVSIGNAMGFGIAAYDGIVSRKSELLECNELFDASEKKTVPVMRTTAVINAGMSGGGLFDMKGRLVGLGTYRMSNSAGVDTDGGASADVEDTGFVTPVSVLYSVYKRILAQSNGGAVGLMPITLKRQIKIDYAENAVVDWLGLPFRFNCAYIGGKLTVVSLDLASPPTNVKIGDVIAKIGDVEVSSDICETIGMLLRYNRGGAGDSLKLTVARGGDERVVTIDEYRYAI